METTMATAGTMTGVSFADQFSCDPIAQKTAVACGIGALVMTAGVGVGTYFWGKKKGYEEGYADGLNFDPRQTAEQVQAQLNGVTNQVAPQPQLQQVPVINLTKDELDFLNTARRRQNLPDISVQGPTPMEMALLESYRDSKKPAVPVTQAAPAPAAPATTQQ